MTHRLFHIVGEYGLVIVFINVLVDQLGMPVPAAPTLVVAGAIAAGGELPLAPLFLWSMLACLIADCGWYLIAQIYVGAGYAVEGAGDTQPRGSSTT